MSFRNAFKILISRFNLVWSILLFLVVMVIIIASMAISFALPIYKIFTEAEIVTTFTGIISSMFSMPVSETINAFAELFKSVTELFTNNNLLKANTYLLVFLVFTIAYRFILGLYELPLIKCLKGQLSDNAKYGFLSSFFSLFGKSCLFSLIKMVVMSLFDAVIFTIIYFVAMLVRGSIFLPTVIILLGTVLYSIRYSLISGWSPAVIVDGMKIFPALLQSVKNAFKHFATIFSIFVVFMFLCIIINLLVGLLTFAVGVLVTIPVFMLFLNLLNMTYFYSLNSQKYYVENIIFDPVTKTLQR